MVYVDTNSEAWWLRLNEAVMREDLNSAAMESALRAEAEKAHAQIVQHVTVAAEPRNAANYAAALYVSDSTSDAEGIEFSGPFSLGNRPVSLVELVGDGPDSEAKPPLMVEADHHSLTSVPGFAVGVSAEDIR